MTTPAPRPLETLDAQLRALHQQFDPVSDNIPDTRAGWLKHPLPNRATSGGIADLDDEQGQLQLDAIAFHHNAKPRKSLGWKSLAELFLPRAYSTSKPIGLPSSTLLHLGLESA